MYNCEVLMSTYNGEKYLREQIDSILNQKNVKIKLLVRDDGSKDNTIEILKSYSNIEYYSGENLKPAYSFMHLLKNSSDNYEFYAFSDQDDVWKNDKISKAIEKLKKVPDNKPAMYFCNKEIVDESLQKIEDKEYQYINSFESSIIKNIATGCTIVINKKLRDIINEYWPKTIEMHDSWIYRVCMAIDGIAIYDSEKYIMYRQHSSNVIGARETIYQQISRRINSFKNCKHVRENAAKELLNGYSDYISEEKKVILNYLANYRTSLKYKIKLLFKSQIKTESKWDNFIFKMALIVNRV